MDNQTQEALKMAIEALSQDEGWFEPEAAIKACKEALVNEKKQYDFDAEFDAGVLANE